MNIRNVFKLDSIDLNITKKSHICTFNFTSVLNITFSCNINIKYK